MASDQTRHEMLSSLRRAQYRDLWGDPTATTQLTVADQIVSLHTIDAPKEAHAINGGRAFQVLLTDGLSDFPHAGDAPRTELIWFVEKASTEHTQWIQFIATVHIMDRVDLYFRTMPMTGNAVVAPLADQSLLSSVTFLSPPIRSNQKKMIVDGAEMYLLWVLPITEPERKSLQDLGDTFGDRLGAMLDDHRHPIVLNPKRPSYV